MTKQEEGYLLELYSDHPVDPSSIEQITSSDLWIGGTIKSPQKTDRFGSQEGQVHYAERDFTFQLGSFLQNHPAQSAALYSRIVEITASFHPTRILDLYSGIGITSCLFSALGSKVDAIEFCGPAVDSARINQKKFGSGTIQQFEGAVEKILPKLKGPYDIVFANPPRTGMDPAAVEQLLRLAPRHLLYLSCMPSTLARDLDKMRSHYRVILCAPYDMFPQTAHVETLVLLQKWTP